MMKQRKKTSGIALGISLLAFLFLFPPAMLQAGEVTLAWDPNSESNLAGYKLYYDGDSDSEMYQGIGASEGDSPVVIYLEDLADADSPTFTLTGLENGQYYYFVLTAFDTNGLESDYSDEVGTLIDLESDYDKALGGSSGTSSNASGGSCFISGAADGRTRNQSPAAPIVLLLLAAVAATRPGRILKSVKIIHPRRKKNKIRF